ncbi:MAG: hypothetical protein Q8O92_00780 [Candidatus Latescibacter sp.]|nr:hypothetical protein [Candidatus Latescibacter sp.]
MPNLLPLRGNDETVAAGGNDETVAAGGNDETVSASILKRSALKIFRHV